MKIADYHEKIFQFLIEKHRENPGFKFTTRMNKKYERLDKGYWFIGGEDYLELSFWKGKDSYAKINNIGFTVLLRQDRKEVYYNLSCKDGKAKRIIEKIAAILKVPISGNPLNQYFEKNIVPFLYDIEQVIDALDGFIKKEKLIIDKLIQENPDQGISFIKDEEFAKNIALINSYRT